jgi:uncharacterized protein (TIGR02246 family)
MATVTVEKELRDLEKQYWQALKDKDVDRAIQLTDFPCIVTGAQGTGRIDKQTFAAMMKDPPYTIHRVDISDDVQVRLLTDDIAVVAYKVHEELTVDGNRVMLDAADSSTWIRRDGHWLCALHSEAILGDPFGRDRTRPGRTGAGESSQEGTAADERAIRDLIDTWMAASRAGDTPKVLTLMAEDVVFMVPGRDPFGKEAFTATSREMSSALIEGKAEIRELKVLGDWAWGRTHLDITITTADGKSARRSGYTLTIFRKQSDGRWVIARDANLLAPA